MPSDQTDRDELNFLAVAGDGRFLGIFIIERVREKPGREFFADVIGEMKRKRISVMSETLIDVPEHLSIDRIEVNRYAGRNNVASAVKIAEHVSTRK